MEISFALSREDITRCFIVISQFRPYLTLQEFAERVAKQQQAGYKLVFVEDAGEVMAVAGFRILEMFAHGRLLYVDDLVTIESMRSKGFGSVMFDWLANHAQLQGCAELHLDSGVQRARAHHFYFRKRMPIRDLHFALQLRD